MHGREGSVGTFEYVDCGKPVAEATRPSTAIVGRCLVEYAVTSAAVY